MRLVIAICLILGACRDEQNLGNVPTRQLLATSSTGRDYVRDLKVNDGYVYWMSDNTFVSAVDFYRVPREGGAVETIVEIPAGMDPTGEFVVDDTYVYTTVVPATQQAIALVRVPKAGGGIEIMNDGVEGESVVAVDNDFLYTVFSDGSGALGLRGYAKTGGPSAVIASPVTVGSNVVPHDTLLFFVDQAGTLVSVPRIGGSPTEVALHANTDQLVADADNLYLVQDANQGDGPFSTCTGHLSAVAFSGGSLQSLDPSNAVCSRSIAVGSNVLYSVEETRVVAYGLDGGAGRDLVTEMLEPEHLAIEADGSALYYEVGGADEEFISLDIAGN